MKNKKYLIINPFGIGDVLFTTPMIESIKQDQPNAFVGYLCNKRAKAVFENNPHVDKLFIYERDDFESIKKDSFWQWLITMWQFIASIRDEKFDVVFDCSLNTQYGFMCLLAGIKKRIGFNYKKRGRFLTKKIDFCGYESKHVVDYYLDLLDLVGINKTELDYKIYLSEQEDQYAIQFLHDKGITQDKKIVALCPGGGASWGKEAYKKQWPLDKWLNLTEELLKDSNMNIFVCAAPGEEEIAQSISKLDKQRVFTSQGCSIRQFMSVLAKADIMIANDGGPMHMASALGVATIGIFGPVDESVYGARRINGYTENLTIKELNCRPCYKRFRMAQCNDDLACLKKLEVTEVLKLVKDKLYG